MSTCSSPPSISNGYYVIPKGTYVDGDQISYYCKMGYELDGSATRSCDGSTGSWSGSAPTCTEVTTTTTTTTTTTAASISQLTAAGLVLIPCMLLLLFVISIGVLYCILVLHCHKGCKKKSVWIDGEDHVHYGCWYACCSGCCEYISDVLTCQICKKVRPMHNYNGGFQNFNGDIWNSGYGRRSSLSSQYFTSSVWNSPRNSKDSRRSSPSSQYFNSSVWNSPRDSRNGFWKPNLESLPESSSTPTTTTTHL
ncbi:uncharacterized protein LOC125677931 [Ostrea edulis]|uniref:uncharacterized protein LOC125677931 n=1 Tax=Ostrea edulis TaxID=37623 RepID=UPI0020950A77|nr:uncharacterized protein LOC125677931 [Ostrea edulis]